MGAQSYAVGAQPLRSGCAAIAQWMRSNYAVNAQPLRSECTVIAQWVRSITHIDYAVLRSECAAVTQRYAVIPLCVMAGFTQITQSLRRRQLADAVEHDSEQHIYIKYAKYDFPAKRSATITGSIQ